MKIEIGKVYHNKTTKYLMPMIRQHYDDMLVTYLKSVGIMAVGIGDFLIQEKLNQHLFVLIDTKFNPKIFTSMIEYIYQHNYYERDYPFDDVLTGRMQMVVFKLKNDVIDTFMKGSYSELYSYEDACNIIQNEETLDVIMKSHTYQAKFIEKIKDEYTAEDSGSTKAEPAITLTLDEIGDRELDLPPKKEEEIFNHKEPSK